MTKQLIVNADDYGRTASVSAGIRCAHLRGIVTTTTAMMNMPSVENDIRLALEECPNLGLGVHLVLTAGRPVLPPERVPSLAANDSSFYKLPQMIAVLQKLKPAELRAEWRAQIEEFLRTGAMLDHLDSHHHATYFTETAFGVMLELANEYHAPIRNPLADDVSMSSIVDGLPDEMIRAIRQFAPRLIGERSVRHPDHFVASFYDQAATAGTLLNALNTLPDGITELMCHPGYVDDELLRGSAYNRQREGELEVLTGEEATRAIRAKGIELTTFRAALKFEI